MVRVDPFEARVLCGALLLGLVCLPASAWAASDAPPKTLSVPDAVAEVLPSVVSVMAHGPARGTPTPAVPSGSGSGVVISPGYILTSNHLVAGATRLVIGLYDGRLVPGRVVGRDFLTDLAIIKVEIEGLVPAKLGSSSRLRIGETVVAIGNPLAIKGGATVSVGVVSALDRAIVPPTGETLYSLIQSDAAINPGNSGGPLVDLSGRVVGINTAVAPAAQNIGYAIAVDEAVPVAQSLIVRGGMLRPPLGFVPVTVTPSIVASFGLDADRGVLVLRVESGGPASEAGLRDGDVITAVDVTQVYNMSDLWHALLKDGSEPVARLSVVRKATQEKILLRRPVAK
ncbi:MAG: trypsin-like peptidase domain-containing protein [Nitrospirales bacterium]|nr:trypsin-like peptidase domain-containing protein [Nitrospirales bacterium]